MSAIPDIFSSYAEKLVLSLLLFVWTNITSVVCVQISHLMYWDSRHVAQPSAFLSVFLAAPHSNKRRRMVFTSLSRSNLIVIAWSHLHTTVSAVASHLNASLGHFSCIPAGFLCVWRRDARTPMHVFFFKKILFWFSISLLLFVVIIRE